MMGGCRMMVLIGVNQAEVQHLQWEGVLGSRSGSKSGVAWAGLGRICWTAQLECDEFGCVKRVGGGAEICSTRGRGERSLPL